MVVSVLCPTEYSNISSMPKRKFPSPETIARRAINTEVEHSEEKIPLRMPAKNAPIKPRCFLLEIILKMKNL